MAEMTRAQAVKALVKGNPRAGLDVVEQYVDQWLTYQEAQANIEKNGAIVAHPRTGAPLENPYLRVREVALAQLRKLRELRDVSALWKERPAPKKPARKGKAK